MKPALPATAYRRPKDGLDDYNAWQLRLSSILRRWRHAEKRKIADVADDMDVSLAAWGHWETMRHAPSVEKLHRVSSLTKIPVDCMFCRESENCPALEKFIRWKQGRGEPPPSPVCPPGRQDTPSSFSFA